MQQDLNVALIYRVMTGLSAFLISGREQRDLILVAVTD